MARLYLIRHPHTRPDPAVPASQWGLSETGEAQVRALVNAPFWRQVVAVYTSTHLKTKVVGEVVHQVYGLPVYEDAGLDEAAREGWLSRRVPGSAARIYDHGSPAGVRLGISGRRARAFRGGVDAIAARHSPDDSLAIATHASVLTLYLAHVCEAPAIPTGPIGFAEVIALDRVIAAPADAFIAAPYDGL